MMDGWMLCIGCAATVPAARQAAGTDVGLEEKGIRHFSVFYPPPEHFLVNVATSVNHSPSEYAVVSKENKQMLQE